jgi:hypothetical protein
MMFMHRMCVIPRGRRLCGAGILRLVRLHNLEVGFGCLLTMFMRERSPALGLHGYEFCHYYR